MADKKELVVNGYMFESEEEYKKALEEKYVIEQLAKKLNLNDGKMVVGLYNSILEEKKFSTVIGMDYMKILRNVIIKRKYDTQGKNLTIPVTQFKLGRTDGFRLSESKREVKELQEELERQKEKKKNLLILNIFLFIVIGVMFYIASSSDNINILNYETEIRDKYSQWEAELEAKEDILKQWEKQLQEQNR